MPDSPDYSKFLPGSVRFSLQDFGELAARLGSPTVFDRRGEIIWYDDFRHGLSGWITTLSGAGSFAGIVADHIYRSPYQAKLIAGSTLSKYAVIGKRLSGLVTGRVGIEIVTCVNLGAQYHDFQIIVNDGTTDYYGRLRYTVSGSIWSVFVSGATYENIIARSIEVGGQFVYIPVKYVIDIENAKYSRLLLGDMEFDISAYALYSAANSSAPNYQISLSIQDNGSFNPEQFYGHVIITANEP